MQPPPGSAPPLISRGGCGGLDVQGSGLRALFFFARRLPPAPHGGTGGGVSVPRRCAIAGRGRPPLLWRPLGAMGGAIYFYPIS